MLTAKRLSAIAAISSICFATSGWAKIEKREASPHPNRFALGLGLAVGSSFHDALVQAYSDDYDVSGGSAFFDIQAGFEIHAGGPISVVPRLRMLGCPISIGSSSDYPSSKKAAIAVVPSIGARYTISERAPSFYTEAAVGLTMPSCDLNRIHCEPGGMALGAAVGYAGDSYEFEFGYTDVPVDVGQGNEYDAGLSSDRSNWCGVSLLFRRRWDLR